MASLFLVVGMTATLTAGCDVPTSWKCAAEQYSGADGCHCECGAYDPDCELPYQTVVGCEAGSLDTCGYSGRCQEAANSRRVAVSHGKMLPVTSQVPLHLLVRCQHGWTGANCESPALPPAEWICGPHSYDARDGCQCLCGAWDPDCDEAGQIVADCDQGRICTPQSVLTRNQTDGNDGENNGNANDDNAGHAQCLPCSNRPVNGQFSGLTSGLGGECGVACDIGWSGQQCDSGCSWMPCDPVPAEQMLQCYSEIPGTPEDAAAVVDTLERMLDFYAFTDISLGAPDPSYPLSVDLRAELGRVKALAQASPRAATLHDALVELYNSLNDAHTAYLKPASYSATWAVFPLFFGHFVDTAGRHQIFVETAFFQDLQPVVGANVTAIDGVDAVQVLLSYANTSVGISRDLGTRFNLACHMWPIRSLTTFPLSQVPSEATVTLSVNDQLVDITIPFYGYSKQAIVNAQQLAACDFPEQPAAVDAGDLSASLHHRLDQQIFKERYVSPSELLPNGRPLSASPLTKQVLDQQMAHFHQVLRSVVSKDSTDSTDESMVEPDELTTLWETESVDVYALKNTLILHIKSFSPRDYNLFISTTVNALLYAQDNDLERLMLDLRDNGGGDICLGYSVLDYIFKGDFTPYGQYDFPAPPLAREMAAVSADPAISIEQSLWVPGYWISPETGKAFTTDRWMNPPVMITRNGVTSPYSQRVHDDCSQYFATWPLPEHHKKYTPDDVMVLSHGFCGSTCAVFSKHLTEANSARTVTIGGLPNRPQSIASFPGGQVLQLSSLLENLAFLNLSSEAEAPRPFPITARFSFTVREIYSWTEGHTDVPLDFLFEPSTFHAPFSQQSALSEAALYAQAVTYFDHDPPCSPNCPGLSVISIFSIVVVVVAIVGGIIAGGYYYWRNRTGSVDRHQLEPLTHFDHSDQDDDIHLVAADSQ
ncbi:MAG: hypothetical protein Q8P67_15015 [archaeon]|nr:hypothetical protein [archaeon]